jgi:hypothetical protein
VSEHDEIAVAEQPVTDIEPAESTTEVPDEPPTEDETTTRRRRLDRGLLAASFVIAAGLVLIVYGFTSAVTGNDGIDRPEAIESVQPVENAIQVLQQDQIVVDLQSGFEARLVVDGIELPTTIIGQSEVDPSAQPEPGQQIDLPTTAVFDPGNAVLSFQPVDGALIESFSEGEHEVTVFFWPIEDGPQQARAYTWTFNVV